MSDKSQAASGGIGVLGLLGVAFVVLKVTGYVTWSWWWVLLPFYGGFVLVLAIFLVMLAVVAAFGGRAKVRR